MYVRAGVVGSFKTPHPRFLTGHRNDMKKGTGFPFRQGGVVVEPEG